MTIHVADLSDAAQATIRSQLSGLAAQSEDVPAGLSTLAGAAAEQTLNTAAPHEVYNLPLSALAEYSGPEAATQVGVRALITSADQAVATVELPDADGATGAVTTHGPFTQGTADAIRAAEGADDVADGDFELRLLRIPAIYLMTLWLKDTDDDKDLFVPLDPAPAEVKAGTPYTWAQLSEQLQPLAKQQLEAEEKSGEPETLT